jgi:hypothetical protein
MLNMMGNWYHPPAPTVKPKIAWHRFSSEARAPWLGVEQKLWAAFFSSREERLSI